jgi:hypothetical protein
MTTTTTTDLTGVTSRGYRWLMAEDSAGLFPVRTGTAATEAQAWTEAMHAGAAALLAGTVRHLAIAVDDEIPTFGYSPGRDCHGNLDPDRVRGDLAELLADPSATSPELDCHDRASTQPTAPGGWHRPCPRLAGRALRRQGPGEGRRRSLGSGRETLVTPGPTMPGSPARSWRAGPPARMSRTCCRGRTSRSGPGCSWTWCRPRVGSPTSAAACPEETGSGSGG